MPFEQVSPLTFNVNTVRMRAPTSSGIFGLSNAREWIFIGVTDNLQATLLGLIDDDDAALMQHQPTGFVFERSGNAQRSARAQRLIGEYNPAANRRTQP